MNRRTLVNHINRGALISFELDCMAIFIDLKEEMLNCKVYLRDKKRNLFPEKGREKDQLETARP